MQTYLMFASSCPLQSSNILLMSDLENAFAETNFAWLSLSTEPKGGPMVDVAFMYSFFK